MKNFISKGKLVLKIGKHPHTELVVRVKDKSCKFMHIHSKQLRDMQKITYKIWYQKTIIVRGGEYKCKGDKMCLKLRDQRLKTVKDSACYAGDLGLIPGSGRTPGKGNGNPLQYSCLENPIPWMEEPGRLQSTGSQTVRHD